MGMPIFSKSSKWEPGYQSISQTGNPNPKNFKITKTKTIGYNCLVHTVFPDCKNCEGEKILLIQGMTGDEVKKLKEIDPHFKSEMKNPFIIARFHPSRMGWEMGIHMLKQLGNKI